MTKKQATDIFYRQTIAVRPLKSLGGLLLSLLLASTFSILLANTAINYRPLSEWQPIAFVVVPIMGLANLVFLYCVVHFAKHLIQRTQHQLTIASDGVSIVDHQGQFVVSHSWSSILIIEELPHPTQDDLTIIEIYARPKPFATTRYNIGGTIVWCEKLSARTSGNRVTLPESQFDDICERIHSLGTETEHICFL